MTSGARRGELCALRRPDLNTETHVLAIGRAVGIDEHDRWIEKDTKTHQQRRVVLDPETVEVLRAQVARCDARAEALGIDVASDAFISSASPDASRFLVPENVTQRYERMTRRLGIKNTLHKLRAYSATELIAAGVDIRTVAGRLGPGGGGATTLRVYSAWVSEADQRAAHAVGEGWQNHQHVGRTPRNEHHPCR